MRISARDCTGLSPAILWIAAFVSSVAAFAQGPNLDGLYVVPANTFIFDPSEARMTLDFGSMPLTEVQSQLDSARAANPNSPIVLTLTGTYLVTDTPLTLPSQTALVLYGTIRAGLGTTASSLIAVEGQREVSIAGGLLDGSGANVAGIDVENSTKINIDAITITRTRQDGIILNGQGNDVWDSGSAITRCEVTDGGGNGITIGAITQTLVLDSFIHDNKGTGIFVSAAYSSIVNNVSRDNGVGIAVAANDNLISDNELRNNQNGGIVLETESANTTVLRNAVIHNSTVGINSDGSNNLLYDNALHNSVNLIDGAAGNWVVPRGSSLAAPLSYYFYPPTIDNQHGDPVMNGKNRMDLNFDSMSITLVQQAYDAAIAQNPDAAIVLHLNGSFTVDGAPLTLASNTAIILNGTINISSATASNLITAQDPVQFVSFSGGIVDCGGKAIEPIYFPSPIMAFIDQVTVGNCGTQTQRTTSNLIHLAHGSGYNIIHANTLNGGGGRGIWTQEPTSRYIVLENHISNVNEDGVDFDSSTSNSLAIGNVSENNLRYGVFIEQSDSFDKVYANSTTTAGLGATTGHGVGIYNNATSSGTRGVTDKNTVFSNSSDVISNGLRVGSIATAAGGIAETAHSFLFNNVATNSRGDGILFDTQFPASVQNYFSQTVLSGNSTDIDAHPSNGATAAEFFNPPPAINLALHRPAMASSSATGSSPSAAVDGLAYTSWVARREARSWLTIDLGGDVSFERIMLKQTTEPAVRGIVLQVSEDGVHFTDIPGTALEVVISPVSNLTFAPVSARFVRIRIETFVGGPAGFEEISVNAK